METFSANSAILLYFLIRLWHFLPIYWLSISLTLLVIFTFLPFLSFPFLHLLLLYRLLPQWAFQHPLSYLTIPSTSMSLCQTLILLSLSPSRRAPYSFPHPITLPCLLPLHPHILSWPHLILFILTLPMLMSLDSSLSPFLIHQPNHYPILNLSQTMRKVIICLYHHHPQMYHHPQFLWLLPPHLPPLLFQQLPLHPHPLYLHMNMALQPKMIMTLPLHPPLHHPLLHSPFTALMMIVLLPYYNHWSRLPTSLISLSIVKSNQGEKGAWEWIYVIFINHRHVSVHW